MFNKSSKINTEEGERMNILELQQMLEVETPKGIGRIWLVTDYGSEIEKIFTVIINSTGEIWEFSNNKVTATRNLTMGRGKWE